MGNSTPILPTVEHCPQGWKIKEDKECRKHHPDAINEVPIKLRRLQAKGIGGADPAPLASLEPDDQDADHTEGDMQTWNPVRA